MEQKRITPAVPTPTTGYAPNGNTQTVTLHLDRLEKALGPVRKITHDERGRMIDIEIEIKGHMPLVETKINADVDPMIEEMINSRAHKAVIAALLM